MGSILGRESNQLRDESVKRILVAGGQMFQHYCLPSDIKDVLMFPQAPLPKFVDKFPDNNLTKREQKELEQQRQYEAEVKIYKTLQKILPPGAIVLHGFRYTHAQYKMFVSDHTDCPKRDQDEEGECDFLILCPKFVGILEVKAPDLRKESSKSKVFAKNFKESKYQRKRTLSLIEGICKTMNVETVPTFSFTVFGDIRKELVEFVPSFFDLPIEEKEEILFMDDLEKLSDLTTRMSQSETKYHNKLFLTILGLWSINSAEADGHSKYMDLATLINDLDIRLKASHLTRASATGRPASSYVINSPRVFRDLGIKNLTVDQMKIFNSDKSKLWINGPAGSGKTILIAGKVADLTLKNRDEKAVIFVTNKIVAEKYLCYFKHSKVPTALHVLEGKLTDYHLTAECSVHVIYYEDGILNEDWNAPRRFLSLDKVLNDGYHVFFDDFHNFTTNSPLECNIFGRVLSELISTSSKVFWVSYDILQDGYNTKKDRGSFIMREIVSKVPMDCFMTLSANLRNTFEIANLLADIRKRRMENEKEYIATREHKNDETKFSDDEYEQFNETMSLEQYTGHYIHGPMPKQNIIFGRGSNTTVISKKVCECLRSELTRLRGLEVAVVVNFDRVRMREIVDQRSERFYKDDQIKWGQICNDVIDHMNANSPTKLNSSVHFFDETHSAEWPAVIGIVELSKTMLTDDLIHISRGNTMSNHLDIMDKLLSRLYITASRARVYCSIILVLRDLDMIQDFSWRCQTNELPLNNCPEHNAIIRDATQKRFLASFWELSKMLNKHMTGRNVAFYSNDNEDEKLLINKWKNSKVVRTNFTSSKLNV